MVSSKIDAELVMRHDGSRFVVVMTIHVDDHKITGTSEVIKHMLAERQKVFGDLKVERHTFTNCGVRHIQCFATYEITLGQKPMPST